jgi:hypothetical protein
VYTSRTMPAAIPPELIPLASLWGVTDMDHLDSRFIDMEYREIYSRLEIANCIEQFCISAENVLKKAGFDEGTLNNGHEYWRITQERVRILTNMILAYYQSYGHIPYYETVGIRLRRRR